jgi:hypothetical protein
VFIVFLCCFLYVIKEKTVHHVSLAGCQIKDYEIGICCFSAKYAALRRKSKDWLAQNQDNVSECADISTHDKQHIPIA